MGPFELFYIAVLGQEAAHRAVPVTPILVRVFETLKVVVHSCIWCRFKGPDNRAVVQQHYSMQSHYVPFTAILVRVLEAVEVSKRSSQQGRLFIPLALVLVRVLQTLEVPIGRCFIARVFIPAATAVSAYWSAVAHRRTNHSRSRARTSSTRDVHSPLLHCTPLHRPTRSRVRARIS